MPIIKSSGGGKPIKFVKINKRDGCLWFKEQNGEQFRFGALIGSLVNVDFVHNPGYDGGKWKKEPHWAMQYRIEDDESIYLLEMQEGNLISNNVINSLLSIPALGPGLPIYIGVYLDTKDDRTKISVRATEDFESRYEWKYPIEDGWFAPPVPGKPEGKDFSELTKFWRTQFLEHIYPCFKGKDWQWPQEEGTDTSKAEQVLATFKAKVDAMSAEQLKEKWAATVQYLNAELDEAGAQKVITALQRIYKEKGGEGTLEATGELSDLPF